MSTKKSTSHPGRPRAFCPDQALDRALQVFWQKGYEGASLSDLTTAMGINRPSLYATFGDKETLFRKALDRYEKGPGGYVSEALNQPTARAAVEALLRGAAQVQTASCNPGGCLFVHGALSTGTESEALRQELIARRGAGENTIRERLERAQTEGDLPASVNPADLARFVVTVIHGMAVQAASGATLADLERVIDLAMCAWPA